MAKPRRKRVRNPSIPRLEWVKKTYPEWVWFETVIGFMFAVGMDEVVGDLESDYHTLQRHLYKSRNYFDSVYEDNTHIWEQIEEYGNQNTQYDSYIPWLAKAINALGKRPIKTLRKALAAHPQGAQITPGPPEEGFEPFSFEAEPRLWRNIGSWWLAEAYPRQSPESLARGEAGELGERIKQADELVQDAFQEIGDVQLSFGTVARWAEETGANLNDWDTQEAIAEAREWARTRPKGDIVGGDVVYEFDDGWTFQELKTGAQLRCEGEVQDHCVKDYRPGKIGKVYRIFSLRTPDGEPRGTIEWNVPKEFVAQFKAMSNQMPDQDWVERAVEFRLKYIDENLVSPENKLERISHQSELFPPYVGEFLGDFVGVFAPPGEPMAAVAIFSEGALVSVHDLIRHVQNLETEAYQEFGAGGSIEADEKVLEQIRRTQAHDVITEAPDLEYRDDLKWMPWGIWKMSGAFIGGDDELLDQIESYDIEPPKKATPNPKRPRPRSRRKASPAEAMIHRAHRLWEAYDAKPLKRNLVAFGNHVEKMKASSSAKVKAEARRALRAYNSEFRARGWKRP